MMDGLRKAGKSIVGRIVVAILFGFLIFSFALWGIGDIFRGYGTRTVASVGKASVDVEVYRQAFQQELQQLSRRYGRNITTEQAVMAGIDQQVLNRLIAEETLNESARQFKLALPDNKLAAMVTSDQAFAGTDGKFDRQRFNEIIRQAGYTEQRFLNEQRQVALRQQLAQSLAGIPAAPKTIQDALNSYAHEERKIRYFTIGEAELGALPSPSDDVLKTYFEDNKGAFKLPEYRNFVAITLKPSDLADPKSITEDEARTEYDRIKTQLGKPERRAVRQIVFQNKDDAKSAADKIKSGTSFSDIATERNLKDTDTNLGLVSETEIADKSVAAAVFKLEKDQTSDVIDGKFGSVIATVTEIQPGETVSFEQVIERIKTELALKKTRDVIRDLHDKVEDQRAAAKPLDVISKELNLKLVSFEKIDRAGRDQTKTSIDAIPERDTLLNAVFSSDVGVDNEALTPRDGGYVWFDVTGITPSRDRTFDEAKKDVEDSWHKDEVAKAMSTKALSLVDEINKGKRFDDVANDLKRDIKTAEKLTRGTRNNDVPQTVLIQAFSVPSKTAASAMGASASERVILFVEELALSTNAATPAEMSQVETELWSGLSEDYASVFINRTQIDLGLKIHDTVRAQAIGAN